FGRDDDRLVHDVHLPWWPPFLQNQCVGLIKSSRSEDGTFQNGGDGRSGRDAPFGSIARHVLLTGATAKMSQHEDANRGRKIVPGSAVVTPLHKPRHTHIFPSGNLAQAIPELVFEGHARLVSIEYNRVFDDR